MRRVTFVRRTRVRLTIVLLSQMVCLKLYNQSNDNKTSRLQHVSLIVIHMTMQQSVWLLRLKIFSYPKDLSYANRHLQFLVEFGKK